MPRVRQINPNVKYFPPRLLNKLEYIQTYPMTLIEAPSGFGKTTLLEYFFQHCVPETDLCCRYDFESDEPLFIWRQICQQIGKLDWHCGEQLRRCGQPDEDNLQELAQALRELHCPREAYLWLDNYKRWNNDYAREFLTMLGRHGGEQLHIVVTTQPLLGGRGSSAAEGSFLWQMRDEDFAFRPEDISAYFTAAGLPLSDEQIGQLYDLTEGWIMAISLQMLCYLNRGEFEQGGMVALMEHTFWDQLSREEQEFLLKISIFPKFTLAQATALSGFGMEKTGQLLRDKRYFIHFDSESRYFYPHSQLRSLLKEHFSCLTAAEQKKLYLRAAETAVQAQDRINTLRFYYAAGEWERILEQPITSYEIADIVDAETRQMVLDILDRAPQEVKLRHPRGVMTLAFALFIMGENHRLLDSREELQTIILQGSLSESEKNELMGEMELLLSFLEYNRISDMSVHHRRALELLGGSARLISPKSVWTFGSPSIFYLYWRESGKLDQELEEMDTCMPIYYQLANGHGSGAELIMRAEVHLVRGELEQALPLCYQAIFEANSHHQDSICQCGLFLLCQLALLQGDQETIRDSLEKLQDLSRQHREDLSRYTYDLAKSYLAIAQNCPDDIAPWLAKGDITEKRLVMMVQPGAFIIYGRYLLEKREFHKLLGVSQYFMGLSRVFPNLLPQVYIHIYCAIARAALGNQTVAEEELQAALDLAMPDRVYAPFAENFRGLLGLFSGVHLKEVHRRSIREMARSFPDSVEEAEEPFTPRELEVLTLVKDRLTNKEIAERMKLSPHTVRNMVSIMLKKRGFKTRIQLQELQE